MDILWIKNNFLNFWQFFRWCYDVCHQVALVLPSGKLKSHQRNAAENLLAKNSLIWMRLPFTTKWNMFNLVVFITKKIVKIRKKNLYGSQYIHKNALHDDWKNPTKKYSWFSNRISWCVGGNMALCSLHIYDQSQL